MHRSCLGHLLFFQQFHTELSFQKFFPLILLLLKLNIVSQSSERQYSVLEVIKLTEKISGKTIPYEIVERREGDPDKIYASSDYAKDILNWSAEESDLKNIIETTWQIYK